MSTRSFLARPTETGYSGIYVHLDGIPSHHLPLLLTARRYRFGGNTDALTRYLVDQVAVGWDELGTDLLDGAPTALHAALTGGESWPSRTMDDLICPDGSPPQRMTVTEESASEQDLQWGYVLHPHGIEVISLHDNLRGPVVSWDTDPRARFSDHPAQWRPSSPPPLSPPPDPLPSSRLGTQPATAPATVSALRTPARR
nr:hypothetical protein [Streptomyces sp. WAC 06725]